MYDYREYCPIAKASQLLGERWTMLIIRELMVGTSRFNQLRRYLPRISPSLLKSRLSMLEEQGIVARVLSSDHEHRYEYVLTPSGRALEGVMMTLGQWATEWQYDKFSHEPVQIDTLMRDLEITLIAREMPAKRSVLRFLFDTEAGTDAWYVEVDGDRIEACDEDRGFEVQCYLSAQPKIIADILLAKLSLNDALESKQLKVTGLPAYCESIGRWFGLAPYVEARQ